jgi:PTS system fructose-specific IIC component
MAAESLERAAESLGCRIRIETQGALGAGTPLNAQEIAGADFVLIAADREVDRSRFMGKRVYETDTRTAIIDGIKLIRVARQEAELQACLRSQVDKDTVSKLNESSEGFALLRDSLFKGNAPGPEKTAGFKIFGKLVQVPQDKYRKSLFAPFAVPGWAGNKAGLIGEEEGRKNAGAERAEKIESANVKPVSGAGNVDAKAAAPDTNPAGIAAFFREAGRDIAKSGGPYKHLMNGVSFTLPFIMAGGICSALVNAIGEAEGRPIVLFLHIVKEGGFGLITPILAAAIAWSIADRPGIAPGMIGGILCNILNTGFWGGIAAGFVAGYSVFLLNCLIRLPKNLAGLKPMLVLPFAGTFAASFIVYFVIGKPLAGLNLFLIEWVNGLQGLSSIALGILLGGMMALDMGGLINKIAYTFAIGMLGAGIAQPMAAVMAAGMTPPLSAALAVLLFRSRFTDEERKTGETAFVLGISFNSEGALPFAARDPLRAIPSFIAGSSLAGALSMFFGIRLTAPHGGLFILAVPGGINDIPLYLTVIASGTLLSALLFGLFKRDG